MANIKVVGQEVGGQHGFYLRLLVASIVSILLLQGCRLGRRRLAHQCIVLGCQWLLLYPYYFIVSIVLCHCYCLMLFFLFSGYYFDDVFFLSFLLPLIYLRQCLFPSSLAEGLSKTTLLLLRLYIVLPKPHFWDFNRLLLLLLRVSLGHFIPTTRLESKFSEMR